MIIVDEKLFIKEEKGGQLAFDFSKKPEPVKEAEANRKEHKSRRRTISEREARERIAGGEFSTDVEPWMSDEEKSDKLLQEQEDAEYRYVDRMDSTAPKKKKPTDGPDPVLPKFFPEGVEYNRADNDFNFDEFEPG